MATRFQGKLNRVSTTAAPGSGCPAPSSSSKSRQRARAAGCPPGSIGARQVRSDGPAPAPELKRASPTRPGRSLTTVAALLAALSAGACGSVEETLIERGRPPAYARGYADGCASGKEAAGGLLGAARKDASRYGADAEYTPGWDAGFAQCRADMAAMVLHARVRNRNRDK